MSSMGEDPIWDQFRQNVLNLFERYLGTAPQKDFSEDPNARRQVDEQTRILLITVSHMLYPITTEVLYQVFSPYGLVEKIVPLSKSNDFPVLIQFRKSQNAISAKKILQGRYIYDGCCQMDIRFFKDDEIMVVDNESTQKRVSIIENLRTNPSVLNTKFKKPIEVGKNLWVSEESNEKPIKVGTNLCVAEESREVSPNLFTAHFVAQLIQTKPTTNSKVGLSPSLEDEKIVLQTYQSKQLESNTKYTKETDEIERSEPTVGSQIMSTTWSKKCSRLI